MSHDELAAFLSEISENPELMEELRSVAVGDYGVLRPLTRSQKVRR
jgi:hypothetical protein